ncbi:hypothetical protein DFQ27_000663 [Actinomortierella ambigua]|uniref:Uncharacterized protein n=1 Tax=Actinomortierella ambigua TaxID=1343610 RepID=A0A9P6QC77_9FUNG|nr:hypothetical protein DFQ27_000663 [Actinomortierella ambigua]
MRSTTDYDDECSSSSTPSTPCSFASAQSSRDEDEDEDYFSNKESIFSGSRAREHPCTPQFVSESLPYQSVRNTVISKNEGWDNKGHKVNKGAKEGV